MFNIETDISIVQLMVKRFKSGNKLLLAGNGGSSSDCGHIMCELMKGFLIDPKKDGLHKGVPVIDLTANHAFISAWNNDCDPNLVYAQQVNVYGKESDMLMVLTTSGNSTNIFNAVVVALDKNMDVIIMTGSNESSLLHRFYGHPNVKVVYAPSVITYTVQEYHIRYYHQLCREIESCMQ